MRNIGRKWWVLAAALPVAALIACSSDSPIQVITPDGQVYSQDEYDDLVGQGLVDDQGNVIDEEVSQGVSSDAKVSSASKPVSSSSVKVSSDSGSGKSLSSAAGGVSSSAGSDVASSEVGAGDVAESSSSAVDDESSSSSAIRTVTVDDGSGNFSVGTDIMEVVDSSEKTELDSLKEVIDNGGSVSGFEDVGTNLDEETMTYESFEEGDYFCFIGEGEWMHITRELLGRYIPHYKNGQAWGNLSHFDIKFMDACQGVYFRRK